MLGKVKIFAIFIFPIVLALMTNEVRAGKSSGLSSSGTLYVIDATGKKVTLKNASGALTTLNIWPNTKIQRNGKKATLTGLVLGDQVSASYDSANNARELRAKGPKASTIQGGVVAVSTSPQISAVG